MNIRPPRPLNIRASFIRQKHRHAINPHSVDRKGDCRFTHFTDCHTARQFDHAGMQHTYVLFLLFTNINLREQ
ncbi:Uncharacterised protein [Vibrio cholerae]|nr:Uncharacterised protein [Vibrio cholerae]